MCYNVGILVLCYIWMAVLVPIYVRVDKYGNVLRVSFSY